jgi:hypothetical protein
MKTTALSAHRTSRHISQRARMRKPPDAAAMSRRGVRYFQTRT